MRVGILGINFKSSDLTLREEIARVSSRLFGPDSHEAASLSTVLLSTCNRTEIYFSGEDLAEIHSEVLNLLRTELSLPFEHHLYAYFGAECFAHLCRVTAGLDSAIVAETEIQRQVKTAYSSAACDHSLASEIHYLFQKSLKVSKHIRANFTLPKGIPTLERLIYDLSEKIAGNDFSVFFLGNSEINRKILSHLKSKGVQKMVLCTRGLHSAKDMGISLINWSEREKWQTYDIVICGSNHAHYAIVPEQMQQEGDFRNKVIFDLSLPRNVDPRLARHPELRLFNIEELGKMIAGRRHIHAQWIAEVETFLRKQMENQMEIFLNRQIIPFCPST